MQVKIRYRRMAGETRLAGAPAPFASGLSGLLTLAWVSCLMLALWRLTSDLGWTESFVISEGILSHWQVWLALTIAFGLAGLRLNRYLQGPETVGGVPVMADEETVLPDAELKS